MFLVDSDLGGERASEDVVTGVWLSVESPGRPRRDGGFSTPLHGLGEAQLRYRVLV